MTVFISVPMYGRTDDEVWEDIVKAFTKLQKIFLETSQEELIVRHNFNAVGDSDSGRLFYLGSAIQKMDHCDAVYFCKGWENAKGCQVEHYICELYGIQRIEE